MENFNFSRYLNIIGMAVCVSLLPACALFNYSSTSENQVVAGAPPPDLSPANAAAPVATAPVAAPAAATPAAGLAGQAAPNRYMQFVKEKKPLFEMDMKNEPACRNMATSFGRTSPDGRAATAVRCNPRSFSAVLPVSATMKNPKTNSNYIARFRNKEFCTRVIDTLAQNGKSTVVRSCVDRKKS